MSGESRNLPNGETTTDVDAYVAAWREYAAPILRLTGGRLYAFDPAITIEVGDRLMDIEPEILDALAKAQTPSFSDTEQACRWIEMAKCLDPACPEDEAALGIEIAEALAMARIRGAGVAPSPVTMTKAEAHRWAWNYCQDEHGFDDPCSDCQSIARGVLRLLTPPPAKGGK
jgi:hypothetical protein